MDTLVNDLESWIHAQFDTDEAGGSPEQRARAAAYRQLLSSHITVPRAWLTVEGTTTWLKDGEYLQRLIALQYTDRAGYQDGWRLPW